MKYRVCEGKAVRTLRKGMAKAGAIIREIDIGFGLAGALVSKGAIEPLEDEPVILAPAPALDKKPKWKRK
jgi:hypothetical protein